MAMAMAATTTLWPCSLSRRTRLRREIPVTRMQLRPIRASSAQAPQPQQRQRVNAPPADFDFRAATRGATREVVGRMHPELLDLVEAGVLLVVPRPDDYVERRADGYVEPEVVYVVGTAHMSRLSAAQVTIHEFLFFIVAPQSVEFLMLALVAQMCCRTPRFSRTGELHSPVPTMVDVDPSLFVGSSNQTPIH